MKGNKIVLQDINNDKGCRLEGTISGALAPGVHVEISPGVAFTNGRPTYRVYQPGADGNRRAIIILLNNPFNGQSPLTAYADGDHGFFYVPQAGEEMNVLAADVAGTGDIHTIGDVMIVQNSSGKVIVTTGSPQANPWQLMETTPAFTADGFLWAMYTGY